MYLTNFTHPYLGENTWQILLFTATHIVQQILALVFMLHKLTNTFAEISDCQRDENGDEDERERKINASQRIHVH